VAGLIDGEFAAVRQADCGEQAPALIGDVPRHFRSFVPQLGECGMDVVTHQVKLVVAVPVGWMNGKLSRSHDEDEPASARVYRRQAQHFSEERPDLLSFRGEHDRMHAGDHTVILATLTQ